MYKIKKIILSRKGFDSSLGRSPSPIFPDGSICSLPIPSRDGFDKQSYQMINYNNTDLGRIVSELTNNKVKSSCITHFDTDLRFDALKRAGNWLPLFGQVDAAQTHLENQNVESGDLFLFFGWFRETHYINGRLKFKKDSRDLHVIFGWLQIGEILKPTKNKKNIPVWAKYHPHVEGAIHRGLNNTLYIASKDLKIPSLNKQIPGGGVFNKFRKELCLTSEKATTRSYWELPGWFYPEVRNSTLSYHSNIKRWSTNGSTTFLNSVARGQEFVLDCSDYPESIDWAKNLVRNNIR